MRITLIFCFVTLVSSQMMEGALPSSGSLLANMKNYFSTSWVRLQNLFEKQYIQSTSKSFSTQTPTQFSTIGQPLQFSKTFVPHDFYSARDFTESDIKRAYKTLKLKNNATMADAKIAWKEQVKKWHPDKNPNRLEEADLKTKEINAAYNIVKFNIKNPSAFAAGGEGDYKSDYTQNSSTKAKEPGSAKKSKATGSTGKKKDTKKEEHIMTPELSKLFSAVINNEIEEAKSLLKKGVRVDIPDASGFYLVHYAESVEMLKLLKKYGANLNIGSVSSPSYTPVCAAIMNDDVAMLKTLYEVGAKIVGWRDEYGNYLQTAVIQLASQRNQNFEVISYLLSLKVDPFEKNKLGRSPYDYAVEREGADIAKRLFGEKVEKY